MPVRAWQKRGEQGPLQQLALQAIALGAPSACLAARGPSSPHSLSLSLRAGGQQLALPLQQQPRLAPRRVPLQRLLRLLLALALQPQLLLLHKQHPLPLPLSPPGSPPASFKWGIPWAVQTRTA